MSRIAIIRMHGKFSLSPVMRTTLESLRLTRLYTCTLVPENESTLGMIQKCKDVVSYGKVDEQAILSLLTLRGRTKDGKRLSESKKPEEIAKMAKEIAASEKRLADFELTPVFFLSPARGGFGVRKQNVATGGVMGKNPKICELISKMA